MGEMTKTGKSESISRGLREQDWKMREQIPWANCLKLEIAGAYRMASMNRTGK